MRKYANEKTKKNGLNAQAAVLQKMGFEPTQAMLTTPSRWRVCLFHHFCKRDPYIIGALAFLVKPLFFHECHVSGEDITVTLRIYG